MDILTIFFPSWLLPTAIVFAFSCIFMYARWKSSPMAAAKHPPGPPKLPIIGNFHQVQGKDFHLTLWELSKKYGPVMLLHFGTQPMLVISSSEMVTQVLKTHDHETCTRPYNKGSKRLTYNYMDVAFAPHGDHWRNMRKVLVTELLGAKRTRLFRNVMEIEMEGVVRSLSSSTTVKLDDLILNLVNDVVCKVTVGKSYREKIMLNGKTLKEIVDDSIMMVGDSLSDVFPTFGWILDEYLTGWNQKLDKCFSNLDGALQMILDEHLDPNATKTSDHVNDLVDDFISQLNTDEIKGILMNVFNGAIDTTASALVWAMSEIVRNPRVMEKLQNEIRSCVGTKSRVDESDIAKMTYLKMVLKETLRLHPPVPFLMSRECVSHCQIGGYDVFPGTKIFVNSLAIGRDPRAWTENPTEFCPERFENQHVDFLGKHFDMVPFGGGRRACPGYNSAVSTAEFTIANLLYWFNWELPGGVKNEDLDMEEESSIPIRRKTPLCLVPKKHMDSQD